MANDFSADSNCVALWRFESGALETDSKGGNDLTSAGTPAEDTTNMKEGSCCVDIESGDNDYFYETDANLDAGFPLKNGDSVKKISGCFWFRGENTSASQRRAILAKYESGKASLIVELYGQVGNTTAKLNFLLGYNNGDSQETITHATAITYDGSTYYHVGFAIDGIAKTIFAKIADAAGNKIGSNIDTTFANELNVEDGRLCIGRYWGSTTGQYDGLIDELVLFKDILSEAEIDAIRAGTYGAATPTSVIDDIRGIMRGMMRGIQRGIQRMIR